MFLPADSEDSDQTGRTGHFFWFCHAAARIRVKCHCQREASSHFQDLFLKVVI